MKIIEFIEDLRKFSVGMDKVDVNNTCDTVKAGETEREISKVAVSMFATPEVVAKASDWGANFLIVHEPTFYSHMDIDRSNLLAQRKQKFIEEKGITVFRYHDYMHSANPDMIFEGEMMFSQLNQETKPQQIFAINRIVLDNEMTALELASYLEEKLGIKHIRIAGCTDKKGKNVSCCFGTPGHITEELDENDFVLTGEICEWQAGEYARDYAQLGYNKAILVMGHIGSERAGMMLLAEKLADKYSDIQFKYFECGEVYSYTQ